MITPIQPSDNAYGLREDGGWVNALQREFSGCTAESRQHWDELLRLASEAGPRAGGEWVDTQQTCESQCGYPAPEYADDQPHPAPGSDAYQETLLRCAPTEAWLDKVREQARAIGEVHCASTLASVYRSAIQSGVGSLNRKAPNREMLRALIWFAYATPTPEMMQTLAQLAAWSIEHKTAQANTIGIALAATSSEHAAAALRMIETSAKHPSPKTRFGRYASHVERKIGINPDDSAERFVPTFGLDKLGSLQKRFGELGVAELKISGSKSSLHFFNPAGKSLAAPSAAIKREFSSELQELRAAAKGLDQLLSIQKSRLETLLLAPRSWPFSIWRERYLDHPVVGTLARRLIWTLDGMAVVFVVDQATNCHGEVVEPPLSAEVRLWHPLGRPSAEVMAWRERLEQLRIQQPFKQAHREIYLLTEAERRTETYSNRFAGHILRQSQLRSLATARQWQAPFLGGWDGGDGGAVVRQLPDSWRVEFWVNAIGDQYGESGGLLHISTDQVRFYLAAQDNPSPLNQVPALIFSEALRDVDLFVGVASVGNDPTWHDGGPEGRHREYWASVAFGELGGSAAIRREVLQQLVPKLKIATVCSVTDRYLVVRGSKRTYQIHLGSGNILMEPNNQYLCIVADRRLKAESNECFLPFEGDAMLSIILSKAFLLAEDSKISDPTITRQIDSH